jgi:hypothetical protein
MLHESVTCLDVTFGLSDVSDIAEPVDARIVYVE